MRHITFETSDRYPIALLVKASAFNQHEITQNYQQSLLTRGMAAADLVAFSLAYNDQGKAPVKFIKGYLEQLLPALDSIGVQYLYLTDAAYFKVLAGVAKADPHYGYVLPCKIKGYEHMNVVLGLNYQALIYNPELQAKLDLSLDTLASHVHGTYQALGANIIHSAQYPDSLESIQEALESLHQYPSLTCDIEAFSLRFNEAGIGTIAFAWDEHNGIAFACDYEYCPLEQDGEFTPNLEIRRLLKEFFESYQGEITWHNSGYDLKVIIFTLWMEHLLDTPNLLKGLEVMTRNFQDTKLIAYLATNSTAGNVLGLKPLAHPFAGNWAKDDIKDIRKIPLPELLQYNLVDALSTHWVRKKYEPIMIEDQQEELYKSLFLPSQKLIIQMELTGFPMDPKRIQEVKAELEKQQQAYLDTIQNSPVIHMFNLLVQQSAMEAANAKLKVKQHPIEKFSDVRFNPNSGPQLQRLLYEQMCLPVLDYTDTKQLATGADTIKKLVNHTQEPAYKEILQALIGYGKVQKILTAFIPSFEQAVPKGDGKVYLHGNFNLGGTVSARLSSSGPNLQQLPSGSTHGKLIKSCFSPPKGWLLVGADFNALEARIDALLTKDPNKIRVLTDGYDSHCFATYSYWPEQFTHLDDSVKSINSIKDSHPKLRQASKAVSFAKQYGGTYRTLMNTSGFPEEEARRIEANYDKLYVVSKQWKDAQIEQAAQQGYAVTAFGLRIRTPLLKQVLWGQKATPREAEAEARTVGNAIGGQSFGLLNNRAANEFMEKVWTSLYRYDVLPVAQIHDSQYYLVRDNLEVIHWVNQELPRCMAWQGLPEIQHPQVKLGAETEIYWPDWSNPVTLPNDADQATIKKLCQEARNGLLKEVA